MLLLRERFTERFDPRTDIWEGWPTDLDGPVEAAGDDPLHVPGAAVQGEAGHRVVVAGQHRGAVAGIQLPHADSLVAAAAEM